MREIFDLGLPTYSSEASQKTNLNKMSKMQKVQINKEHFRLRTKNMNKKRENKRSDVAIAGADAARTSAFSDGD